MSHSFCLKGGLLTQKRITIRKKRERDVALLIKAGWKKRKGQWVNPRTGRKYDEDYALTIEALQRTMRNQRI